jgi:hypothetical protein
VTLAWGPGGADERLSKHENKDHILIILSMKINCHKLVSKKRIHREVTELIWNSQDGGITLSLLGMAMLSPQI